MCLINANNVCLVEEDLLQVNKRKETQGSLHTK